MWAAAQWRLLEGSAGKQSQVGHGAAGRQLLRHNSGLTARRRRCCARCRRRRVAGIGPAGSPQPGRRRRRRPRSAAPGGGVEGSGNRHTQSAPRGGACEGWRAGWESAASQHVEPRNPLGLTFSFILPISWLMGALMPSCRRQEQAQGATRVSEDIDGAAGERGAPRAACMIESALPHHEGVYKRSDQRINGLHELLLKQRHGRGACGAKGGGTRVQHRRPVRPAGRRAGSTPATSRNSRCPAAPYTPVCFRLLAAISP